MKWKCSRVLVRTVVVAIAVACSAAVFGAEADYATGHRALEVFGPEGFGAAPAWVQAWLAFLISMFAIGLYFAWKHPVARWASGGFIVSAVSGEVVFSLLNLPFLSGAISIMHILCWSPALVLLLVKRPFLDEAESLAFRVWTGLMAGSIIFSFLFDIKDAVIYINHVSGLG